MKSSPSPSHREEIQYHAFFSHELGVWVGGTVETVAVLSTLLVPYEVPEELWHRLLQEAVAPSQGSGSCCRQTPDSPPPNHSLQTLSSCLSLCSPPCTTSGAWAQAAWLTEALVICGNCSESVQGFIHTCAPRPVPSQTLSL